MRYPIRNKQQMKSAIESLRVMPSLGMIIYNDDLEMVIDCNTEISADAIIERGYKEFEFYVKGEKRHEK